MNPIGFVFRMIGEILVKTPLKRLVINEAYAKFLIIVGGLEWHDLPHLHHPLIYLRIGHEFRLERKAQIATEGDKQ